MIPVKNILDYYCVEILIDNPGNDNIYCCCPFHIGTGATPKNFSINRTNGLWRCFSNAGCGDGNIITFIMKIDKCSKAEARSKLKSDFKGEDTSWSSLRNKKIKKELEPLVHIPVDPDVGLFPLNHPYLEKRQFKHSTFAHFDAGYDPFRDHYIFFPVVFKGMHLRYTKRDIRKNAKPPWHHDKGMPKKRILYNFDQASQHEVVIVTEGVFDVIRLWELGFPSAVATFGSKATTHQIELLHNNWNTILIAFDGDAAGIDGGIELGQKLSSGNVKRITFDIGVDPGSIMEPAKFLDYVDKSEIIWTDQISHPTTWGGLRSSFRS